MLLKVALYKVYIDVCQNHRTQQVLIEYHQEWKMRIHNNRLKMICLKQDASHTGVHIQNCRILHPAQNGIGKL